MTLLPHAGFFFFVHYLTFTHFQILSAIYFIFLTLNLRFFFMAEYFFLGIFIQTLLILHTHTHTHTHTLNQTFLILRTFELTLKKKKSDYFY